MKKLLIIFSVLLVSCGGKTDINVDISNISVNVELERFDMDFNTIKPENIYDSLPKLKQKYGDFFDLYVEGIAGLGSIENHDFLSNYEDFYNYCKLNSIFSDIEKNFPKNENLKPIFEDGFKHFKYYFPNDSLPKIYTIISGFQESIFPTDNIIAFSLEKYFGQNYPSYAQLGIENYKRRRMTKEALPVDFFRTLGTLKFPKSEKSEDNLLNEMIYKGRLQFFLKSMLPQTPDSLLWGYSDYQYRWAETYESNVWTYLIDRKLLFETNPLAIRNLTGEGPFTNAFGNQSAPGVASFCGFGIVCSFMQKNPQITLKELMEITDLNEIYSKARYNP